MVSKLAPLSLVAKVLCRRHNTALGAYDAPAGKLVGALKRFNDDFRGRGLEASDDYFLVSGEDIERFMLKYTFGLLATGKSGHVDGGVLKKWRPPRPLLDWLFGAQPPDPTALMLFYNAPTEIGRFIDISARIMGDERLRDTPGGLRLNLGGLVFHLRFGHQRRPSERWIHRPRRLIFTNSRATKTVHFSWSGHSSQRDVYLRLTPFIGSPLTAFHVRRKPRPG